MNKKPLYLETHGEFHIFNTQHAEELGVTGAVLLNYFIKSLKTNEINANEGKVWIKQSIKEI